MALPPASPIMLDLVSPSPKFQEEDRDKEKKLAESPMGSPVAVMRLPPPHIRNAMMNPAPVPEEPAPAAPPVIKSVKNLKQVKKKGFDLPGLLNKMVSAAEKLEGYLDKVAGVVMGVIGFHLKYIGLGILIAGFIQLMIVLCTVAPAAVAAGGIVAFIMAQIKAGALPAIFAGVALYKFGKDMIENKGIPSLGFVSWILPTPFYNMLNVPDPTQNKDPNKPLFTMIMV